MAYSLQLRNIRKSRKMSAQQLADALGIARSTLYGWENGDSQILVTDACRICDVLGCTLDQLAGRDSDAMTMDEQRVVDAMRSTDERGRSMILAVAAATRGDSAVLPRTVIV